MRLTERDQAILDVVARYRFLTTSLILSLVPGSRQNITRRLQRLYHSGLLERPRAQLALRYSGELSELVYCPSPKVDEGRGYRPTTSLFLAHALMVSEVLIRIESDCRTRGAMFIPEHEILVTAGHEPATRKIRWRVEVKTGEMKERVGVIPDAAFAIDEAGGNTIRRRYFFVEVDRGTMPVYRKNLCNSSIRRKALAYARTRKTRALRERFGIPGFQVLFVATKRTRLARMKEVLPPGTMSKSPLFLFATPAEVADTKRWVMPQAP